MKGGRGAQEEVGYNGGAISDGNVRHVGMRYTPPGPLILKRGIFY